MSEETKIQWATSTGNPWIGCTKVSPGCKNCYAAVLDDNRFSRTMGGGTKEKPISHWGKGAPRFRTTGFWKDAIRWNKNQAAFEAMPETKMERENFGVKIERPRIFPSLCDWLDEEVPIEWLADFLKVIHDTPHLDWLLLTKRPENFHSRIGDALIVANGGNPKDADWFAKHGDQFPSNEFADWLNEWTGGTAPANVWFGFSAENQEWFDKRYDIAKHIPTRLLWCSMEPLLGPIDMRSILQDDEIPHSHLLDWAVIGGESGDGARPCYIQWIADLVRQCKAMDVVPFVKQLGAVPMHLVQYERAHKNFAYSNPPTPEILDVEHSKGGDPAEWPAGLNVREFPTLKG